MDAAPILVLTGSPGSGKTTVARLLAERAERSVHLESDRFFEFIVGGYVDPSAPESHEQNKVVMRIAAAAAAEYASAGYWTVIDGIFIPGWFFEPVREEMHEAGFELAYAVLRPPRDVAVMRASNSPEVVERLWDSFSSLGPLERHVIEFPESQSADRTATEVSARLRSGALAA